MANAAPNAFGAQLAYPGRQTIAMCGDGGFTMLGLGDLLTQVERRTPVVQIVLNNSSLDFVNIEQQEAGFVPFGVEFKNPNFAKVAEAMGAKGIRIEEPGEVRAGLAEALAYKDGPVVVDAVVDPFALSLPSHVPLHTAVGFTLSVAKQVWNGKMDDLIKRAGGEPVHTTSTHALDLPGACLPQASPTLRAFVSCEGSGFRRSTATTVPANSDLGQRATHLFRRTPSYSSTALPSERVFHLTTRPLESCTR
jgi:hypothetical protein